MGTGYCFRRGNASGNEADHAEVSSCGVVARCSLSSPSIRVHRLTASGDVRQSAHIVTMLHATRRKVAGSVPDEMIFFNLCRIPRGSPNTNS
jgi:hypothetical protein